MAMVKDYLHNKFKHGIEAGKLQYGVGQEIASAEVAEILATSNYDWLFVDGEHGSHSLQGIFEIARAVAAYDIVLSCRKLRPAKRLKKLCTGRDTRRAAIVVSVRRRFALGVTADTRIILNAKSTRFAFCRRLRVGAGLKILRLSSKLTA